MGYYKYMRELWKKPKVNNAENYKKFLMKVRREPVTVRVAKPTRIDRARSLGYKAKEGIIIIRQRINKGGYKRNKRTAGLKHGSMRRRKVLAISKQIIAERRSSRKHPNLEVLNSYWVAEDGRKIWYEVIMVNPFSPVILSDKKLNWTLLHRNRALRGLTSAGRRSRGLHKKGIGTEHIRPSKTASLRRTRTVQGRKGREYTSVMNNMRKLIKSKKAKK